MADRNQKIKELMESLHALRSRAVFGPPPGMHMPHITPSQWRVLLLVMKGDEHTVKDIAKTMGVSSSAATQLVDGLVASGYVIKKEDKNDRRKVSLTLSKTIKDHVMKMKKRAMVCFLKTFEVLNDKEFAQYIALNKKLVQGLSDNN